MRLTGRSATRANLTSRRPAAFKKTATATGRSNHVSQETENKAIVGRWFTEFWGPNYNPDVIDELAAPDIRFEYSMHAPLRGRDQVREFARKFRAAFPDLGFGGTADLIADGDYVVGQWKGGGTQTGDAFDDLPSAPYRPEPARRWTSPAPPSSRSRTASSPRRSASTTA
jgi:hypothetical protein